MEKTFARVEELADSIKEYVNTRIKLAKLSVAEKSSSVIANVLAGIVVAIVFLLFILFASIALSFGLGEWIGKTWAGFLIVGCLYLLIGMIVWFAREKMIRLPVMNAILRQLFRNDEESEDHEKDQ
jgi:Zn-dependent protease with chaperone function